MGMFDYINVEAALPDGYQDMQHKEFQTKDLECYLLSYTITADGRLTEDGEPTPYYDAIEFYAFRDEAHMIMVDFLARFEDGKLISIEVLREG